MQHNQVEPLAMSVADACRSLNLGRTTFYAEVAARRIKLAKVGARTLVPVAELHRYLVERIADAERGAA